MNVLVATDGSDYGRWGLNWAAKLPFVEPAKVTVLHVLDHAKLLLPFRTKVEIQRVEARSERALKKATEQLAALKLDGTVRKEKGAIAPTILKRAPKRDGFLVVGSKGLDALDRFTLGSVSTKLIQHATCPVLVVKGDAPLLRRVALAIDGSPASAKALEFVLTTFQPVRAARKGRQVPIHVSVIHVMASSPLAPLEVGTTVPWIKQRRLKEKDSGRRLVEQSAQKLIEAGFTADALCQHGNPAEKILQVASKQHVDLIVMGAKGLAAIDRFLLGSVSTRVVQHANSSVLVVR
ncbi:MAG: universal stress protein [Nitrospira sp.]|nr:MAG: universal stress protein [Nitrospira sp.]